MKKKNSNMKIERNKETQIKDRKIEIKKERQLKIIATRKE